MFTPRFNVRLKGFRLKIDLRVVSNSKNPLVVVLKTENDVTPALPISFNRNSVDAARSAKAKDRLQ
jgi:hypothetical protein